MNKNKSIDGLVSHSAKIAGEKKQQQNTPKTRTSKTIPTPTTTPKSQSTKSTSSLQPLKSKSVSALTSTSTTISISDIDPITDFLNPVQAFDFDEQSGKLTASKSTQKSQPKPQTNPNSKTLSKPTKKPAKKSIKIIKIIIIIILLLLLGVGVGFILWGNEIIAKITGGQGNVFDLLTFIDEKYEPLKTDTNGRTNILAIGTSGYNMNGDEGNGVHDGAQLTDSIMVISLDQETGDLAMLSLPRDLKASPTCTATGKINEVYWCNNMYGEDETAGATALMVEVGNILGIDFQYYAHLNWGSLVQIVDTLGGITINLDEDIADYYYTGAVFEAGVDYTIDGEQALGLARARHGTMTGDFSRGASQQKILIGIKNKVFEKGLSISDLLSLASTLGDNLRTNFSVEELKTLAHLTSDFDFDNIRQVSLIDPEPLMTTGTINGISYVLPSAGVGNYTAIKAYVAKMFSSDPRIYENASILVLNGTSTAGLAATEQTKLLDSGFTYVFTDDAPEGDYEAEYTLYIINTQKPDTAKLLEKEYDITALPATALPAGITTDYDFVLIIGNSESEKAE